MTSTVVPKTIAALFVSLELVGGHAEQVQDRLWDVFLPVRMNDGKRHDVRIGSIGYYVRDGKTVIGDNVHALSRRIASHHRTGTSDGHPDQ